MIILNKRQRPGEDILSASKTTKQINYNLEKLIGALKYYGQQGCREFVIDESNEYVCVLLIKYFMQDPEFEKYGTNYSLLKGILLSGPIGSGKTVLMKAFDNMLANIGYIKFTYTIIPTRSIERDYIESGNEVITTYGKKSYKSDNEQRIYCFDDLGLESGDSKYYGNQMSVMSEIFLDRYDLGLLTHATTNLTTENLEKIYGERIRSRMSEMFNLVQLIGPDRRKK